MTGDVEDHALKILRAVHTRNLAATVASGLALCASGLSLWETVLRQAALEVYVGDNVNYTRDPWGSYEVLVVPVTIANTGARDGAVVSMRLNVKNAQTGETQRFDAAYIADSSYWSGRDSVTDRTRRPKSPFAPLSISGRGRFSGTILFYASEAREQKLIEPKARIDTELTLTVPPPRGWLDKMVAPPAPDTLGMSFEIPNFLPGALLSGDFAHTKPFQTVATP